MRLLGNHWERVAEKYLHSRGLITLARNYHCKYGEIDLVMREEDTLIFAEVRFRKSQNWANAAESVTISKQKKIIRTAQFYLLNSVKEKNSNCRFDVVSIDGNQNKPDIQWLVNAFEVNQQW